MREKKDLTVMFFFAGDNALSPLIVSQIKSIKDAGFQEHTNVLVYFDSQEKGVPTRILDVNRDRKNDSRLPKTLIGGGNDPFIRNMKKDSIGSGDVDGNAGRASARIKEALTGADKLNAEDALENFIGFCRESFPADNYMLFLVGHGLIVGRDTFLPDENPDSSITLKQFEAILRRFSTAVRDDKSSFQLLALHSCSMSAIEVAYQIQGTANYLMASEGISYVGSWPYRQLLMRTFNAIRRTKKGESGAEEGYYDQGVVAADGSLNIPQLIESLYNLTMFNAFDFMFTGYSLDVSLCSLSPDAFNRFVKKFQPLVQSLKDGLHRSERCKELILLAHWESQSYWEENYTDLYDFCLCLGRRCDVNDTLQSAIKKGCDDVIGELETSKGDDRFGRLVVRSENFGSKYQYSHGLSVYFPWSEPTDDEPIPVNPGRRENGNSSDDRRRVMDIYEEYAFNAELKGNSWFEFLKLYFETTMRKSRPAEDGKSVTVEPKAVTMFATPVGALSDKTTGSFDPPSDKTTASTGVGCTCPSIKNYPVIEIPLEDMSQKIKAISVTEGMRQAIE